MAWNFAYGLMAAAAEDSLWVSEDGHYFRRGFPNRRRFRKVFVRADGLIAVRGDGRDIDISRDRGWTWGSSAAEGSGLARVGQWISLCDGRVTLSSDGNSWVETQAHPFDASIWIRAFELDLSWLASPSATQAARR